ncbi:MAG: radical SAM protein [Candidatus Diapherotrites archaeon]|nr:radical SAM protein [Candidatus Diapherotrites archaeon]
MEKEVALFEVLVGFACNNNCRFCSIDFEKRRFNKSTAEIKQDILRAKQSGAEILGFTGGEPTIRKDIFELVEFAKKQGFRTVRIQTNGRMFASKEFTKRIIEAGANYFKFTINGHKAKIHDFLTQVPGSFEQTITGLKNVKALGRTVEVNILINKQNYKFLPQMVKFFIDLGISQFTLIFPSYIGNALVYKDDVVVTLSEAVPYVKEAIDIIEDYELDKAVTVSIPPCFMQGYEKYATTELYPMRTKIVGPKFEANLDDKMKEEKRKAPQCEKCKYGLLCRGVRYDYVDLFGFDEIKPVPGKKIRSLKDI